LLPQINKKSNNFSFCGTNQTLEDVAYSAKHAVGPPGARMTKNYCAISMTLASVVEINNNNNKQQQDNNNQTPQFRC